MYNTAVTLQRPFQVLVDMDMGKTLRATLLAVENKNGLVMFHEGEYAISWIPIGCIKRVDSTETNPIQTYCAGTPE